VLVLKTNFTLLSNIIFAILSDFTFFVCNQKMLFLVLLYLNNYYKNINKHLGFNCILIKLLKKLLTGIIFYHILNIFGAFVFKNWNNNPNIPDKHCFRNKLYHKSALNNILPIGGRKKLFLLI
jgi:hypothetical protein